MSYHPHMQERLAKFMGTEESIIYSYDLATVPSVLPAFANAKDVIVCDEVLVSEASLGAAASRHECRRRRVFLHCAGHAREDLSLHGPRLKGRYREIMK